MITKANAGPWIDSMEGIRISSMIVEKAISLGYVPSEEFYGALAEFGTIDALVDWEWISDEADDAETWLNDHVAPKGYYFGMHPDQGDWGLYSTLMNHDLGDLSGVGPVESNDFVDWFMEVRPDAVVIFEGMEWPVSEMREEGILPEYVEITREHWGGSRSKMVDYHVEIERA
jgi:hypothetical protein